MSRLLLTLALICLAGPAAADPVSGLTTALVGFGLSQTAAAALAAGIVRVGGYLAVSALTRAVTNRSGSSGFGVSETYTFGEAVPQSFILGTYATSGHRVADMSHGVNGDTRYFTRVLSFGNIPMTSLEYLIVDGVRHNMSGAIDPDYGATSEVEDYTDHFWVKAYDGRQTAADPGLLSRYGSYPERPWTAQMIGRGLPYGIFTFLWRNKPQIWTQVPRLKAVWRGVPLYDPRKDSTVGGTGAHRFGNAATYEPSANLAVMIYNVYRGIYADIPGIGSVRYFGGQASFDALPLSNWIAAMNVCDEEITTADGTVKPRFTGGLEVKPGTPDRRGHTPFDVVDELLKACGGKVAEVGGRFFIQIGGVGLPVRFITDETLIRSQPRDADPFLPHEALFNAVHATYPSPDELWETREAPGRYDLVAETEDGERLIADYPVMAAPDVEQVQRVGDFVLKDFRRMVRHNITLPPDALSLNPLEAISWTSAQYAYTDEVFEIGRMTTSPRSLLPTLSIRAANPIDANWTSDQELPIVSPSPAPVVTVPQSVPGWTFAGVTVQNELGADKKSGLQATWFAELPGVDLIEWEVRLMPSETVVATGVSPVSAARELMTDFVIGGEIYQGRARPVTDDKADWTDWVDAVAPVVLLTADDIAPLSLEDLAQGVSDAIDAAAQSAASDKVAAEAAAAASAAAQGASEAASTNAQAAQAAAVTAKDQSEAAQAAAQAAQAAAEAADVSASESAGVAVSTARDLLPYTFAQDGLYFTTQVNNAPDAAAQLVASSIYSFVDTAEGRALHIDARAGFFDTLSSIGTISVVPGRTYRATIRYRQTAGTPGALVGLQARTFTGGFASFVSEVSSYHTATAINTWYDFDLEWTAPTDPRPFLRFLFISRDTTSEGDEFDFVICLQEDVTESTSAEGHASAAATSEAVAGASADEAGQSAAAAQTALTAAQTAQAGAESAQTNAAQSATTAAGSASNAASSATDAANAATSAGNAASAASTSASTAQSEATNAGNSATAAQSAQVAAESARDDAHGSATAAAGSASNASTSATDAGQSATAAQAAQSAAQTAQAGAESAQTSAAQSATDAAGSASSASTSSNVAASAQSAAQGAARSLFPSGFEDKDTYFRTAWNGAPSDGPLDSSAWRFVTAAGEGTVAEAYNLTNARNDSLMTDGVIATVSGRTYRITVRACIAGTVTSSDGPHISLFFRGLNHNYDYVERYAFGSRTLTTAFADYTAQYTVQAGDEPYMRPGLYRRSQATGTGQIRISRLIVEDVTESVAAEGSASAAAVSASTAEAEATDAAQSASSAISAQTAAETARSGAETAQVAASQSATNAAGSASQAQIAAGVAVTARNNAGDSATAAANSASVAQSEATDAGVSAGAAQTSAANASSAAGAAAASETLAAGYASDAEGFSLSAELSSVVAAYQYMPGIAQNPGFVGWTSGTYPDGFSGNVGIGQINNIDLGNGLRAVELVSAASSSNAFDTYLALKSKSNGNTAVNPSRAKYVRGFVELSLQSGNWGGAALACMWRGSSVITDYVYLADTNLGTGTPKQTFEFMFPTPDTYSDGGDNEVWLIVFPTSAGGNGFMATTLRVHHMQMQFVSDGASAAITQEVVKDANDIWASRVGLTATVIQEGTDTVARIEAGALSDYGGSAISYVLLDADYVQLKGGMGILVDGVLQSDDFVAGSAGWQIDKDGNAEFNSLITRNSLQEDMRTQQWQLVAEGPFDSSVGTTETSLGILDLGAVPRGSIYQRAIVFESRGRFSESGVTTIKLQSRYKQLGSGTFTAWRDLETFEIGEATGSPWQVYSDTANLGGYYDQYQYRVIYFCDQAAAANILRQVYLTVKKVNL